MGASGKDGAIVWFRLVEVDVGVSPLGAFLLRVFALCGLVAYIFARFGLQFR